MNDVSILDQIIENKQNQVLADFNPRTILDSLLNKLNDREKEVISLRYGLKSPQKKTLEEIGKNFQVTRERIRQIENSALKKIKSHPELGNNIKPLEQIVNQSLEEHGGIMHHDFLLDKILIIPGNTPENRFLTSFIIHQFLSSKLNYHLETEDIYPAWKLPTASIDNIIKLLRLIISVIEKQDKPLTLEEIFILLNEEKSELTETINDKIIHSYLVISKNVEKNPFNEWGLINWQSISLKRMSDKVYLILKKSSQPLHFTKIAEEINKIGFDNKKANPATIHNELILDNKYVLVGRGIYALKEWGYQPGVVADVIKQIIKESGPLTKDEIIEKVLEKRQVKESTIVLALMNRTNFSKGLDKKYILVNK